MTGDDTRRIAPGKYLLDGRRVPSVTTILQQLAKPALVPWAAKVTAALAADSVDVLAGMTRDAAIDYLKAAPNRERGKAAARGTDVHRHAEALVHGAADDVPPDLLPLVESCARFLDRWRIEPALVEVAVFSRASNYAGSPDLFATCGAYDDEPWLFDYKTGSGIYPETALQLAAYRYAEFHVGEDGAELPVPEVVACAAVHLQPGRYEVRPIEAGGYQVAAFHALAFVAAAMADADTWIMPPRGVDDGAVPMYADGEAIP